MKKVFEKIKCSFCGSLFTPISSVNKVCSHKCKQYMETANNSKVPKLKVCIQCNDSFKPYTSLDKFCSAKCRIEHMKSKRSSRWSIASVEAIKGKNNPAYRNGTFVRGVKKSTAGEHLFIRNSKEIKQCMIDDKGFVYCQNCNTSNSLSFESHHIIYRSEKPLHEHLHDKRNLFVMCIQCHNEFHKHKSLRNDLVIHRGLNLLFGNDVLDKKVLNSS